jgi:MFS-type transporter involved in bile tolerance (Atg22 family)
VTAAKVLGLVPLVGSTAGMTATIGLVTAGLLALIAGSVSARRGWGRWLFAVIYVIGTLGVVMLVLITPETFRTFPLVLQANMVVQFVLQTAALVLMFSSTSRQWFRTRHAATAP